MTVYYKELASGRWKEFTLPEQMANIGSEVHRTITWFQKKDNKSTALAFEKALELFDLTLEDERWKGRRKEIARSRELFCSFITEPDKYENLREELNQLDNYFFQFGLLVSKKREAKIKSKDLK